MKNLLSPELSNMRREHPAYGWGDACGGYFVRGPLRIIASSGEGWDHLSVSLADRTPTWGEMDLVKRLFFEDHEAAYQLHPPVSDHINHHPNVLHLW